LDYVFIDPPFGANLMYSELNFLWEAWLGVFTNNTSEALVNKVQRKGLLEYQHLMEGCFREFSLQGWCFDDRNNDRRSVSATLRDVFETSILCCIS